MENLLSKYMEQKKRVLEARDRVNNLNSKLTDAETVLSAEQDRLANLAIEISHSDDPLIVAIRSMFESGELQ